MIPAIAEHQQKIEKLLREGAYRKALCDRAGSTIQTAAERIAAVRQMLDDASLVLSEETFEEQSAREIAKAEVRYWLLSYARAAPMLQAERGRIVELQAEVDRVQDLLRPLLEEHEQAVRAKTTEAGGAVRA